MLVALADPTRDFDAVMVGKSHDLGKPTAINTPANWV
jgi:hypothetical protein